MLQLILLGHQAECQCISLVLFLLKLGQDLRSNVHLWIKCTKIAQLLAGGQLPCMLLVLLDKALFACCFTCCLVCLLIVGPNIARFVFSLRVYSTDVMNSFPTPKQRKKIMPLGKNSAAGADPHNEQMFVSIDMLSCVPSRPCAHSPQLGSECAWLWNQTAATASSRQYGPRHLQQQSPERSLHSLLKTPAAHTHTPCWVHSEHQQKILRGGISKPPLPPTPKIFTPLGDSPNTWRNTDTERRTSVLLCIALAHK